MKLGWLFILIGNVLAIGAVLISGNQTLSMSLPGVALALLGLGLVFLDD